MVARSHFSTSRMGVLVAATALMLGALSTTASAVDPNLRRACMEDYFAYCSQHDPDTPGLKRCMRVNGPKLSQRCFNALVAAGKVSKASQRRRARRLAKQ